MSTSKGDFSEKHYFSFEKTMILMVPGGEVGSNNRSSIDQQIQSVQDAMALGIVFLWDFGGFLGPKREATLTKNWNKSIPKRSKHLIDFWKPLGTWFFRPRSATESLACSIWSGPTECAGSLGNLSRRGIRRHSGQELRICNLNSKTYVRKDIGRWKTSAPGGKSSTPSELGGGSPRAFRRAFE